MWCGVWYRKVLLIVPVSVSWLWVCSLIQMCVSKDCQLMMQGSSVEERIQSAGGVSTSLVEAFRTVLSDTSLDGAFASAAITLPDSNELLDQVPGADPLVLHQVSL